jgi:CBS domain
LLFVKDLIFIDPEDNTRYVKTESKLQLRVTSPSLSRFSHAPPTARRFLLFFRVEDFVNIFGRALHVVWPDDSLGDVLRELKKGKSHMALVRDVNNEDDQQDPYYEIKGIVTLEDIIEEILGEEIVDETDAFVNNTQTQSVNPLPPQDVGRGSIVEQGSFRWGALRLLDAKLVDETLSHDETKAVVAHLSKNYAHALGRDLLHTDNRLLLTEKQLYRLVATTPVSLLPSAAQDIGQAIPSSEDLLYEKGVPNDYCTIILSGKVTVLVGADNFRSDVSSWSVLAADAMTGLGTSSGVYKPDFSAFVSAGPCRCLRISRAKFSEAVDSSALERQESSHVRKNSDSGGGGSSMSSVAKLNSKTTGSHVHKSSDGGGASSSGGSGAKSNSKTIGSGTISTSGGAIVLGGNATGGTSSAATTTATPEDGTSALPPIMNDWGSSKKQRIFAALKVAAGKVPPAQSVSSPPPNPVSSVSSPPPNPPNPTSSASPPPNPVSSSTPPPPHRTRSAPTSSGAPNTATPLDSTAGPDSNNKNISDDSK